jgi:hypothetical protein
MAEWIMFSPELAHAPPTAMADIVGGLTVGLGTFANTATDAGGLRRDRLREVAAEILGLSAAPAPLSGGLAHGQLDFYVPDGCIAVAVQAGRAWTNNEALLAVLAAASQPAIEWLVLLVPMIYKRSAQYPPIVQQLQALAAADGVDLDLKGVVLLGY